MDRAQTVKAWGIIGFFFLFSLAIAGASSKLFLTSQAGDEIQNYYGGKLGAMWFWVPFFFTNIVGIVCAFLMTRDDVPNHGVCPICGAADAESCWLDPLHTERLPADTRHDERGWR